MAAAVSKSTCADGRDPGPATARAQAAAAAAAAGLMVMPEHVAKLVDAAKADGTLSEKSATYSLGDEVGEIAVIKRLKHKKSVTSLASTDAYIFSGSADKTVKVWDWKTLEEVATLKGHRGEVTCLRVDTMDDGRLLYSSSQDNSVRVWHTKPPFDCAQILRDRDVVWAVATAKSYVATAPGKTIKLYKRDDNANAKKTKFKFAKQLTGHRKPVKALVAAGPFVFSGSNDKTIRVWDLDDFECKFTLADHEGWIRDLVIYDNYLFSSSYDTNIKVWSLDSLQCEKTITGAQRLEALAVWNDVLVSGTDDARIKAYSMTTDGDFEPISVMKEHSLSVLSITCNDDLLVTASYDATIAVYSFV